MGRSSNSFTSYVGHAEETIDEERVSLPEKDLWVAVLCRAALDAFKGPPQLNLALKANVSHKNHYHFNRDQARHFFLEGGAHFREICEMAGRNPMYVREKARKIILRVQRMECRCAHHFPLSSRTEERKETRTQEKTFNRECLLCIES